MATMTRAGALGLLHRRVGEYSALADLRDAMARAARRCGLAPASVADVVDADLAALDADDHERFLEVAELRAWESILGNATDMGLRDAGIDDSPASVREAARARIKDLAAHVKAVHGVGLAALSMGTIGLDFQAGADDGDDDL